MDDVVGQLQLLVQQANPLTYITSYPQQQVLGQIATNTANTVQAIYDMQSAGGGGGTTINGDVTLNGGTAGLATEFSSQGIKGDLDQVIAWLYGNYIHVTGFDGTLPEVPTSFHENDYVNRAGQIVDRVSDSVKGFSVEHLAGFNDGEFTQAPDVLKGLQRNESTFRLGSAKEEVDFRIADITGAAHQVYGPPPTGTPMLAGLTNYGIEKFIPDAMYGMRFNGLDKLAPVLPVIRIFTTWAFTVWASVGIFRWMAWGVGIDI